MDPFDSLHIMLQARTALQAAEQKDPRWDQLVSRLMERIGLSKTQVIENIGLLATSINY